MVTGHATKVAGGLVVSFINLIRSILEERSGPQLGCSSEISLGLIADWSWNA